MNNSKNNNNSKGNLFSYPYNFVSLGDSQNINRKKEKMKKAKNILEK